jgi:hypothetical protein
VCGNYTIRRAKRERRKQRRANDAAWMSKSHRVSLVCVVRATLHEYVAAEFEVAMSQLVELILEHVVCHTNA